MNVLDLFSGIGGFSLGLERAGMRTVAFCELGPYPRAVLAKHWPDIPCHDDITTREFIKGEADVICGGFPCQDISQAGNRAGLAGERSGLWRELFRAIRVVRPIYAIVENVAALLNRGMGDVLGDLAEVGYDTEWHCIPARAVGAPHIRDRVWIVASDAARGGNGLDGFGEALQRQLNHSIQDMADADSGRGSEGQQAATAMGYGSAAGANGGAVSDAIGERVHVQSIAVPECSGAVLADGNGPLQQMADTDGITARGLPQRASSEYAEPGFGSEDVADTKCFGCGQMVPSVFGGPEEQGPASETADRSHASGGRWWAVEPDVGRVAHGISARVDRLKGLGNAVVPQIPEAIGRAIMSTQSHIGEMRGADRG